MFKRYLLITKPGIIMGNLVSVLGGFFLAADGSQSHALLLLTLLGVSCVIASGCVFNNYIDRDIDGLMERTRNRVLVKGLISPRASLIYASLLGLVGVALLLNVNLLATLLGVAGFAVYVGLYTLWLKRRSVYGTLVGSLSGATPPVIGYCAVRGEFDAGALLLLIIFSLWQMPHSYAIAIFRLRDYQAAGIPVLPVLRGIRVTKDHMLAYIVAFAVATLLLTGMGYAGYGYLGVALLVSGIWLLLACQGYRVSDDVRWARQLFIFSIVAITSLSLMMSVDGVAISGEFVTWLH